MEQEIFARRLALAAGSVSLAMSPLGADAGTILVADSPIAVMETDPNYTVVGWDVDGDSTNEYQLRLIKSTSSSIYYRIGLFSTTSSFNGRGFLRGPISPGFDRDHFLNLPTSVNVGSPATGAGTLGPYVWGTIDTFHLVARRSVVSGITVIETQNDLANAVVGANLIGFRFNAGSGMQFGFAELLIDMTVGSMSVTINRWIYSDTPGEIVHVNPADLSPETEPPTDAPEPTAVLPTIALLGLGAAGVRQWRKQREGAS